MIEITDLIHNATNDIIQHCPILDEARARHLAERIVNAAYNSGRDAALMSIMDTRQAAAYWSVSIRRAQAHIKALHERYGVGAKFGREWVITTEEAKRHRPRPGPGRPPKIEESNE